MFIDEITIKLIAGKGGDGCTSFRHEKYIEMGGPDGGNGGMGSDIIFEAEEGLHTLYDLKYKKFIKGDKGKNGSGKNKNGADAEDIIIKVPLGTTIIDLDTNLVIADLINHKDRFVVCKGGRGGKGNTSFKSHNNTAPKISELGEPGEERLVKCSLKVLADVGIVGMPSVGKSTLLSIISASKPKIAEYHFTTLCPNLGMVKLKDGRQYVVADLPGLIEGASEGVGLGIQFLKHTERTRIVLHIIDMGAYEGRNPIEDYEVINKELFSYSDKLKNKKQIVVANKMDLENANDNLKLFKEKYNDVEVMEISCMNNEGINELLIKIADLLDEISESDLYEKEDYEDFVYYKFNEEKPYTITNDNGIWVISGKEIETLFKMTRFDNDEAVLRFARRLNKMGVEDELEKMGAKKGDEVQILDYMFNFLE